MPHKKSLALAIAMATAASAPVYAQWSSEPATSAIEVTDSGTLPLVTAEKDGGIYVSYRNGVYFCRPWLGPCDSTANGFDIWLQHYDANGNQSWESPQLIFDTDKQYTFAYDMVTDDEGNAYIANDVFPGTIPSVESTVQIAKINRDGTPGWETPLNLTPDNTFESNGGGLSMATNGTVMAVAWAKGPSRIEDAFGALALFDKDGNVLWNQDIQIDGRYTTVTKPIVTDDSVLVLLEVGQQVGTTQSHYYVQKYALADGSPMWSKPLAITSGGNFSHPINNGRAVQIVADGEGGLVMSWYHILGIGESYVMLQQVYANGDKKFPGQGLRISGDHLGNSSTSLAYDGDTAYVTWVVSKTDYDEEGSVQPYSGVRGAAISADGEFIWSEDGSTEPATLLPWRVLETRADYQDQWFRGYTKTALSLNQDDSLNLTYAEEKITAQTYALFTQVFDPANGAPVGEPVAFTDGAIAMGSGGGYDRTIFGQPVFAYTAGRENGTGPVKLVNFDGQGLSGVSEDILVEKRPVATLSPGQHKTLELKVLDNAGSAHDNMVESNSSLVDLALNGSDTDLQLDVGTAHLLLETVPLKVKVQDVSDSSRVGTSTIKIRAPHSVVPTIAPIADQTVDETESVTMIADILSSGSELQMHWQQTAGPAVEFTGNGAELTVVTDYVAVDTLLSFSLTVLDGMQQASTSVDILVANTSAPSISGGDASVAVGESFSFSPEISGAKAPYFLSWAKTAGADTVWTESSDGTLTGTAPLSTGTVEFTLTAEDANGEVFSKNFKLSVNQPEESNEKKKSGGSFGSAAVLLLGLAALVRRRFGKSI
ncbi:hypothetical protein [uncultured Microbulbifer sp.]|uniref:hypothetical protein n=1 Tax=uncultured Microbulbifer sp. TaxID=348147 RepID=UPI0025D599DB|nr:hypothetical protein [uncultured Microbulbifer sp.]